MVENYTLLIFYRTSQDFGHIINYLLTSLVRSVLVKYRTSVFSIMLWGGLDETGIYGDQLGNTTDLPIPNNFQFIPKISNTVVF